MAGPLLKTAVTLYPANDLWASQFYLDRHELAVRRLKLVLTGQGTVANPISFASLGFANVVFTSTLWDATNGKAYPVAIDPANSRIYLLDATTATPVPADITTTVAYITVVGELNVSTSLT